MGLIHAQNSRSKAQTYFFVILDSCVTVLAMVTINHQVKISYEGSEKEWLVPSQLIKDAENCGWPQWL